MLAKVGLLHLKTELSVWWPEGGPVWDALAVASNGTLLLVEAKAHIAEICTERTRAGPASLMRIVTRLDEVASDLGALPERAPWHEHFYQLANRLAALSFFRQQGIDARLVLVGFLNDVEMAGPEHPESWEAAYTVATSVMGLRRKHRFSRFIHHVHPDVTAPDRLAVS